MVRAITKFDLSNLTFLQGISKAQVSYYHFLTTGDDIEDNLQMWYLPWAFDEYEVIGSDHYDWLSSTTTPVDEVSHSVGSVNIWMDFNIPLPDIEGFISGSKTYNGFTIHGETNYIERGTAFYSKESDSLNLRPKLTIIYDMPLYAEVISPAASASLRPSNSYNIKWYSNSEGPFTIELLKGGAVVDTIVENVSGLIYEWSVGRYESGTDYSVRVSDGIIASSNEPLFEIINFIPKLTVSEGKGSGSYLTSTIVDISGTNPEPGMKEFVVWRGDDVSFIVDTLSENTSLTMPDKDATIEAIYDYIPMAIPGKLEAELPHDKEGLWIVDSDPRWGGATVAGNGASSDSTGFWIAYKCLVDSTGTYTFNTRVAHLNGLDYVRVEDSETGKILGRYEFQGTNSSDSWFIFDNHSKTIELQKGLQTLKFYVYGNSGWFNIDFFEFIYLNNHVGLENKGIVDLNTLSLSNVGNDLFVTVPDHGIDAPISVDIYDVKGRKVLMLFNRKLKVGEHRFSLSELKRSMSSGYFFIVLKCKEIKKVFPLLINK